MKKSSLLLIGSAVLLTITLPIHAQGGCLNSPENPTVVLALVGSAGAALASVRNRIKARRSAR
jgi:XrtJ-associated TM-motif-TM protein